MTLPISSDRFYILETPSFSFGQDSASPDVSGVVILVPPPAAVPPLKQGWIQRWRARGSAILQTFPLRWMIRKAHGVKRRIRAAVRSNLAWFEYSGIVTRLPLFIQRSGFFTALGLNPESDSWAESRTVSSLPLPPKSKKDDFLWKSLSPPEREPLPPLGTPEPTIDSLRELLHRYEATAVVNPIGLLPHDFDAGPVGSEPLVVLFTELLQEFTDAYGPWTDTVARETALWCRLARIIVFSSEHDRRYAIKRYGLREEKTRVVTGSRITGGPRWTSLCPTSAARQVWNLPERFMLGVDSRDSKENTLLLFQALHILRWRGFPFPPLVLVKAEPGNFPSRISCGYEEALDRAVVAADLQLDQSLFVLSAQDDRAQAQLEAAALIAVITDRWSANACRRICSAALQRCPVIAVSSPAVDEEWGSTDAILLSPPDDPVALANAIQFTLEDSEATLLRVNRAFNKARAEIAPPRLGFLQELLEEVAGQQIAAAAHERSVRRAG